LLPGFDHVPVHPHTGSAQAGRRRGRWPMHNRPCRTTCSRLARKRRANRYPHSARAAARVLGKAEAIVVPCWIPWGWLARQRPRWTTRCDCWINCLDYIGVSSRHTFE
jgi:hypothetical protein